MSVMGLKGEYLLSAMPYLHDLCANIIRYSLHILYIKDSRVNEWWLAKGLADSGVLVWPLCADKMCVSSICDKCFLAVCHKA